MKINLKSTANQKEISNVRRQITSSTDLKRFDSFLAKHQVIDFNDEEVAAEARVCCGGENCCRFDHIEIGFSAL